MNSPDRTRYAVAGLLLLIVLSWLVIDAWRGNWGRVAFQDVLGVVVAVVFLTLTRLPKGPRT